MSFSSIVTTNGTFLVRSPGVYSDSTVVFGDPYNELRLRGNSNKKTPTISIVRTKQFDVTVGSATRRVPVVISTTIQLPPDAGIPLTAVDLMFADIAEFITPDTLSAMFQGKS